MALVAKLKKKFYFVAAAYFRFFANFALRRWSPRIIALTGSAGKTTMLHICEFQLGDQAHYSHDANSAFGVAFDLLGLKGIRASKLRWAYLVLVAPLRALYYKHHEKFYVVEIDGERPRETEFLARWLRPEITLWISLGRSHAIQFDAEVATGKFANLDDAIADEFAKLAQYTGSYVFIDRDNPLMRKYTQTIAARVLAFSKHDLVKYSVSYDKTTFQTARSTFRFASPQPRELALQLLMTERLMAFLGLELRTDLSSLVLPPSRSSYFRGKHDTKIIDSSYNAHMISMQSILEMAGEIKTHPKWLIIGDIVEQGNSEAKEHTRLAELIQAAHPDQVILVGRRTHQYTYPALRSASFPVRSLLTPQEALRYLERHLQGGELLVFKGSQYLEWIIEHLLLDPSQAALLCRREPAAVKRRAKHGLNPIASEAESV